MASVAYIPSTVPAVPGVNPHAPPYIAPGLNPHAPAYVPPVPGIPAPGLNPHAPAYVPPPAVVVGPDEPYVPEIDRSGIAYVRPGVYKNIRTGQEFRLTADPSLKNSFGKMYGGKTRKNNRRNKKRRSTRVNKKRRSTRRR